MKKNGKSLAHVTWGGMFLKSASVILAYCSLVVGVSTTCRSTLAAAMLEGLPENAARFDWWKSNTGESIPLDDCRAGVDGRIRIIEKLPVVTHADIFGNGVASVGEKIGQVLLTLDKTDDSNQIELHVSIFERSIGEQQILEDLRAELRSRVEEVFSGDGTNFQRHSSSTATSYHWRGALNSSRAQAFFSNLLPLR